MNESNDIRYFLSRLTILFMPESGSTIVCILFARWNIKLNF